MQRILIADVETTGVSASDEIVELSFIEVDESLNTIFTYEQQFKPTCEIHPAASAAHGLVADDLKDKPAIGGAFGGCSGFDDVFLIAHNAQFDYGFLKKFWNIKGMLCTLRVARRIYPDMDAHNLQFLRYAMDLNIPRAEAAAHSAMGDVIVLTALLKRMVDDFGKPLPQLVDHFSNPIKLTTMPFGKHKDKLIRSLPFGYRKWLLGLPDLDDDLRHTLNPVK